MGQLGCSAYRAKKLISDEEKLNSENQCLDQGRQTPIPRGPRNKNGTKSRPTLIFIENNLLLCLGFIGSCQATKWNILATNRCGVLTLPPNPDPRPALIFIWHGFTLRAKRCRRPQLDTDGFDPNLLVSAAFWALTFWIRRFSRSELPSAASGCSAGKLHTCDPSLPREG